MKTKTILLGICLTFSAFFAQAQLGLESIFVERYYVADAIDAANSHPAVPVGAVTYRIYADMLPGFKVQTIFGIPAHPMSMTTTTYFFNQEDYGASIPTFSANNAKKNTVMIDSWLSTGGACNGWNAVPKTEDDGLNNFVNSNVPPLLQNNAAQAGIPLTTQDGMLAGPVPPTGTLGIEQAMLDLFGDGSANGNNFYVVDGSWYCLTGAPGIIPASNKVLIAQITTDGIFHFEINIQIGTPSGGTENYVYSNPTGVELTIPSLIQTFYPVPVPPTITITAPEDGAIFTTGTPILITADADDMDGTVTQVEFFVDGTSIGIDATAPYEANYTGLTQSNHVLTATVTDNEGQSTTSTPVNFSIIPQTHSVTFLLDMSREAISANGVHISGSFNSWSPSITPMSAGLNDIYSVTLSLIEGQEHTFRFVNGNSSSGLEFVPAECGTPNGSGSFNRYFYLSSNDTILDTVCFSMCSQCPADIPVTFRVDMSNETVSSNGVHLAGTFNGWNTSSTQMIAGANNVYSATLMLTPGMLQQYKFVNGNDPSGYETVPSECGSPSASGGYDRYLTVPDADSTLTSVCFGSCVECGGTAEFVNVTFKVDMHQEILSGNGVHIAGSFQGWQPATNPMTTLNDTVYTFTQSFLAGAEIQYRFVNGNSINDYEVVPANCALNGNRFLTVPMADTVLNLVCFASCEACIPVSYVNVTFRVDMALSVVAPEGVHLMGSFQDWDPASTPMTGTGSVYSFTMQLPANTTHEYRFVNGITLNDAEILPAVCSQNGNRFFLSENDTILSLVCFAKCVICGVGISDNISREAFMDIYPNPFSEEAHISLNLPEPGFVKIQFFNTMGQLITTITESDYPAGRHLLKANGTTLIPGFYFFKLSYNSVSGDYTKTVKVINK